MEEKWANDFFEILPTLNFREDLKRDIEELINHKHIPGKSLEGSGRVEKFKKILVDLINNRITLQQACINVENEIGKYGSSYASNNRVFPQDWGERLVRTNLSKFYNEAVLIQLIKRGEKKCFIPHSNSEDFSSSCSQNLAGKEHAIQPLLDTIEDVFEKENWKNKNPKIPDHPHCTHVIKPVVSSF